MFKKRTKDVILSINPLWSIEAIWWHRCGPILTQVKGCCLTALAHHLNQCWLVIKGVRCHSPESNSTRILNPSSIVIRGNRGFIFPMDSQCVTILISLPNHHFMSPVKINARTILCRLSIIVAYLVLYQPNFHFIIRIVGKFVTMTWCPS